MGAGKIQKFDPKAFDKMRGDIKQEKEQAARIAARAPKVVAPKPKDTLEIGAKEVFGLGSRRRMANDLQKKGK